ncbi:MAG: hypothetical protein LBH44_14125 [Treponema sp.]|jgi:hypothetical protein|nr:hypothetical protein [Treponema sp.]
MQVEINARGNGACPLCAAAGNCRIQDTVAETLDVFTSEDNPMELVIYSCPNFVEKI